MNTNMNSYASSSSANALGCRCMEIEKHDSTVGLGVNNPYFYLHAHNYRNQFYPYEIKIQNLIDNKLIDDEIGQLLVKTNACFSSIYMQVQNMQVARYYAKSENFLQGYKIQPHKGEIDLYGELRNMTERKKQLSSIIEYRLDEAKDMVDTISQFLDTFTEEQKENPAIKKLYELVTQIRDRIAKEQANVKDTVCLANCFCDKVLPGIFKQYYFAEIDCLADSDSAEMVNKKMKILGRIQPFYSKVKSLEGRLNQEELYQTELSVKIKELEARKIRLMKELGDSEAKKLNIQKALEELNDELDIF